MWDIIPAKGGRSPDALGQLRIRATSSTRPSVYCRLPRIPLCTFLTRPSSSSSSASMDCLSSFRLRRYLRAASRLAFRFLRFNLGRDLIRYVEGRPLAAGGTTPSSGSAAGATPASGSGAALEWSFLGAVAFALGGDYTFSAPIGGPLAVLPATMRFRRG